MTYPHNPLEEEKDDDRVLHVECKNGSVIQDNPLPNPNGIVRGEGWRAENPFNMLTRALDSDSWDVFKPGAPGVCDAELVKKMDKGTK